MNKVESCPGSTLKFGTDTDVVAVWHFFPSPRFTNQLTYLMLFNNKSAVCCCCVVAKRRESMYHHHTVPLNLPPADS